MRRTHRVGVLGAGLAAAATLLAAGCGYGGVASSAAHPDTQNGQKLFSATCGSCHTLSAAATSGTVGPNLDQLASKLTLAIVVHQVTNGGAVMPPFGGKLSSAQIQAVATYVTSVAGKK